MARGASEGKFAGRTLVRREPERWTIVNGVAHSRFASQIKLIVIDSLSAHFRQTIDSPTRIYIADTIRNVLSTVCSANRVSVRLAPFKAHQILH